MSADTINLTPELYEYLLSHSLTESPILAALREKTRDLSNYVMQISPLQGQFMQWLLRLTQAKKGIEIGVFTGYSALCAALAMPEDGKIIACDVSDEYTQIGVPYWQEANMAHKIDLRLKPAVETLDELLADNEAGTFDYAFIDADKTNQSLYFDKCYELLKPNGIMLIDNTLWGGAVSDASYQDDDTVAIRACNEKVFHDKRVEMVMLPVGDGLSLVRKI